MQQLAQLLPGHRDPLGLGLRDRQHRAPHGGRHEHGVAAAAALALPAQQQQRDVVLAAVGQRAGGVVRRRPVHGLHQGVGEFLQVALVVLQDRAQPPPAGVQVVAAGLDQAVRADQHGLAGLQGEPGRGVVGVRVDAQGQAARRRPRQHRPVGHPDRRVRMPGPGDVQHAGRRVDLHVHTGREARVEGVLVADAVQEAGGAGEDGVGAVALGGIGAQGDAELAHQARRPHVMALHITDDQREPPAGQRDHVVPVAADLEAAAGGDVAGGDAHARDALRAEPRQHRALESVGQRPLALGDAGPGQCLCQHPRHGGQHRPLVRGEGDRVGEGRHPRAHRAAGHGQWKERPGPAAEALGERPGQRVAGLVLLGGGQVHRPAGPHHLGGRIVRVQRHVGERAVVTLLLPVVPDDGQPVALHAEHRQPVR
ncbi:hypothetical protein SVIOM74S_07759 [Streptomyces violarus]